MVDNSELQIGRKLVNRAWQLLVGRVFALFFLFATSFFWTNSVLPNRAADIFRAPYVIFIVGFGLSLVYLAALQWGRFLLRQIAVQFFFDALLISWLVWATGDLISPYITLYTVLICLTVIFFRANVTIFAAVCCALAFTTLASLALFEAIPRFSDARSSETVWRALQIVGFHDVGFLVVGLLAAQLAARQRRSSVELEATVQNLTNLQLLHERIVQSIRSGLVTTDLNGKIYIFNAAAEEITGFKAAQMQGKTIYDLLGAVQQPFAESLAALEKGAQPPRLEIDFVTADNFQLRLGYSVSELFDEMGETTGMIITFQDLTEIRLMEESVRRKDRLAAVGRVAAGLAHEIRNPLGAMRGAIQVLKPTMEKDSAQEQLMDIVLRESDRLNAIITNFLTYARPRASEFAEADLCATIRDAVTLLRHSPDVRSVHQIIEDFPDCEMRVNADAAGLKQVFWNLTRNAMQAMPDGGILTIRLTKTPHNRTQITFTDTGRGMPPSQVERLFEPFSQSTTGGTGLGLSIVYQIIRDHNGTINVRSREGEGTTITVDLPAK